MKQISFRVTVTSLFIFLAFLIITFTNVVQLYSIKSFAEQSTNQNFQLTVSKMKETIKNIDTQNSFFLNTVSSSFLRLDSIDTVLEKQDKYITIFTNILKESPNLYATYFAFEDASFFEMINLSIDKRLQDQYKLSQDARWLLIYIDSDDTTKRHLLSYDSRLNLLTKKTESNSYDPTSRPWYKNAFNAKNSITKSTPYNFKHIEAVGITYAKQFNDTTTIASDVLLNNLQDILEEFTTLNSMENFLFLENGELISASTKELELLQHLRKFLEEYKDLPQDQYISIIEGKKYIINLSKLHNSQNEYLLSTVLLEEAMDHYAEYFNDLTIFATALFLLLLPLIWYFASIIVKPVQYLKQQSLKVKNRDYTALDPISSRVQEIQELSDSMIDMAESIHIYQNELEDKVKERTQELEEKNKELERVSITDKLTGIYNRIKLDHVLEEQILRGKRYKEIFSLIIIDVDHFKKVNDIYGHQVGDTTLVEIATILKDNIRLTDVLGRWGGEEFIIISPHTTIDGIVDLAEQLRQKIQNHTFPTITKKTASFGVTSFKNEKDSMERIIRRADLALYKAKEKGRNRVEKVILDG